MREIKFIAYDKYNKNFTNYQIFDDLIMFFEKNTGCWKINKNDRFILSQYTGLKDKKGKEIYEGDLVKLLDSIDEIVCVVKYDNGNYILKNGDYREELSNCEERFLLVVGNIFEEEK